MLPEQSAGLGRKSGTRRRAASAAARLPLGCGGAPGLTRVGSRLLSAQLSAACQRSGCNTVATGLPHPPLLGSQRRMALGSVPQGSRPMGREGTPGNPAVGRPVNAASPGCPCLVLGCLARSCPPWGGKALAWTLRLATPSAPPRGREQAPAALRSARTVIREGFAGDHGGLPPIPPRACRPSLAGRHRSPGGEHGRRVQGRRASRTSHASCSRGGGRRRLP